MTNGKNGNGSSNGVHKDASIIGDHDLLWDGLSPAVTQKLSEPLDPSLVSRRKGRGNRSFAYVEGRTAIDQANRIFGFGGWGHEVVGEVVLREIDNVDPKTGEVTRIRAYSATVRVTVAGAQSRTDVGFHTVAEENGEGHETAYKGAVTDAMKRALRTFGDQFGNALYGEQPAAGQAAKRAGAADSLAPSLRKKLVELGVEQGFDEEQFHAAVKGRTGKSLDELTAPELTPLVEGAARKLQQMREAQEREAK